MKTRKIKFISKFILRVKNFLLKKNVKYNGLVTILLTIFVAIIILFNLVITKIVDRYDIKLDLTFNSLYKVSDQTEKFLKSYAKDVKLFLLDNEESFKNKNIFTKHTYNIIKNMAALNSHISLEFINLDEHPNFASKYPNFSLTEDSILIVSKDNEVQYLPIDKLMNRRYNGSSFMGATISTSSNVENMVARSLEFISGENKVFAVFLQGHDEVDLTPAVEVFGENGYDIKSLNLITKPIADDVDLVFLVAPKVDFTKEEIKKLEEFIKKGGNLVYFASTIQPQLENLDNFFASYGINFEEGLVIETDSHKMMEQGPNFIFVYGDKSNKYTENISGKNRPILLNDCRPMKIEKPKNSSIEIVDICRTSDSCAIYGKNNENIDFKNLKKSSFPLTVGITDKLGGGKSAKITVFSSVCILNTIEIPQYGNGEFVFSVLGETSGHKSNINILPKVIDNPPLVIDAAKSKLIAIFFIVILPLMVVFVGVFVNVRRKRR